MPSFNFNSAPTGSFSTKQYYATVVQAVPSPTLTTRSQLAQPSGATPVLLQGKTLTSEKLTFTNFTFPSFNYPATIYGWVLCERHPTNAPSGSDLVVSYLPFSDFSGLDVTFPPGLYRIPIAIPTDGVIKLASVYRYTSGSHIPGANGGYPFGLIYLMGTINGTVSYVSPTAAGARKLINMRDQVGGSGTSGNSVIALTDRSTTANYLSSGTNDNDFIGMDFGQQRIRVGVVGLLGRNGASGAFTTWRLWGANELPGGFTNSTIASSSGWTELTTSIFVGGTQYVTIGTNDTTSYWRYLKLAKVSSGPGHDLIEIEFYESTIETPYVNFFP